VIGIIPGVENMPLQIRRGTEAERTAMTQPLAQGELLYVTNDQRLYIGNGSTLGGVQITGYTNEDAQDAAAQIFSNGTHTGITFTYNDTAASLSAVIDLSNFAGTIRADAFKGSVFADDGSTIGGTLLVDAVDGVLRGPHIGTLTGNVTGNITGNVIGNVTGNVTGNTTGYHTGDVKGSVFGDDSSPLVDAVDRIFYGTIDTGNTVIDNDSLTGTSFNIGTTSAPLNTLSLNLVNSLAIRSRMISATSGGFIILTESRGTLTSPAAVQAGDELGGLLVRAFTNTTNQAAAGTFGFFVDPTAVIAGGNFVKTKAIISASSDTGAAEADALILDSAGVATANAFVASKYTQLAVYANDAARTSAIPTPAKGMTVFMTAGTSPAVANKAVIYNGTAWALMPG
jgi:hypothetical protein